MSWSIDGILAVSGLAITLITVIWNLAETKRKLENQFQESDRAFDLTSKDLEIRCLQMDLDIKDFFYKTTELVNLLGSKVDQNSGAIEAFKSMRSNSSILGSDK